MLQRRTQAWCRRSRDPLTTAPDPPPPRALNASGRQPAPCAVTPIASDITISAQGRHAGPWRDRLVPHQRRPATPGRSRTWRPRAPGAWCDSHRCKARRSRRSHGLHRNHRRISGIGCGRGDVLGRSGQVSVTSRTSPSRSPTARRRMARGCSSTGRSKPVWTFVATSLRRWRRHVGCAPATARSPMGRC